MQESEIQKIITEYEKQHLLFMIEVAEKHLQDESRCGTSSLENYEPNGESRGLNERYEDLAELVQEFGAEDTVSEYPENDIFEYIVAPDDGTLFDLPIKVRIISLKGMHPSSNSQISFGFINQQIENVALYDQPTTPITEICSKDLGEMEDGWQMELLDDCAKAMIRRESMPELRKIRNEVERLKKLLPPTV